MLHESETIAQVRQIASRSKNSNTNQVANDLFNVLKDHKNPVIENIVNKEHLTFCTVAQEVGSRKLSYLTLQSGCIGSVGDVLQNKRKIKPDTGFSGFLKPH